MWTQVKNKPLNLQLFYYQVIHVSGILGVSMTYMPGNKSGLCILTLSL